MGSFTFAVDSQYLPNPYPLGNPWVPRWDVFLGYSKPPFYAVPYRPYSNIQQIQGNRNVHYHFQSQRLKVD